MEEEERLEHVSEEPMSNTNLTVSQRVKKNAMKLESEQSTEWFDVPILSGNPH